MTIPPSRRLDFEEVPVIDLAPLIAGEDHAPTIAAIERACRDIGFMYVVKHQVPPAAIQRLQDEAKLFFARPTEDKMTLLLDAALHGYLPLAYRSYEGEDIAATSNQEGFWVGHEQAPTPATPLHGPNRWPVDRPELKGAMLAYFEHAEALAGTLQRAFALALGLAPDRFAALFDSSITRLKLNHYPPQDNPQHVSNIGVVPHADSGGFTILWQDDNGGLEIESKSGEWVVAPPVSGSFIINLGKIMQIWTGGRFSATPHRVINRGGVDRYSIPLFVNPGHHATIKPLMDAKGLDFEAFNYGDYQQQEWRRIFPIAGSRS